MRRLSITLLLITVILTALSAFGTAQSARRPSSPIQAAVRAFIEGRYDEVDSLTDKLDLHDPAVAAVRGRALIARGRYQDADALLRPVAQRAPQSDAALELGLLEKLLTQAGAPATLERVAALADTSYDGREI